MATAPATPIKPRREMQEVRSPEQFQFGKLGQVLAGVLLAIEPKTVKEKNVPEYLIVDEQGKYHTCLATADLEKKMEIAFYQLRGNPRGHWIEIRYEADDSSFQKQGQSAMKIFKVGLSKAVEPGFEYLAGVTSE